VFYIMLSKPARVQDAAGDDTAAAIKGTSSEVVVRRAALLQLEEAIESAWIVFGRRAGGPHASDGTKTAEKPTIEEIFVAQKAVLEVLGEKGSEKRKHACELSTRGLIDLEEGLGHLLADLFVGVLPADEDAARGIAKRAADKLPKKKVKERWKEKARAARDAAKKRGADDAAVAAAGEQARAAAEAACITAEVDVGFKEFLPSRPDEEAIADEEDEELQGALQRFLLGPPTVAAERTVEMCPAARARLEAAMSDEAAVLIVAAFQACSLGRGGADEYFDEEFHVATVRYSHALRRFKQAHSEFCCWSERSWPEVLDWAIRLAALGHPIPAAEAVAQRIGFDLPRAVAVCQAEWEAEGEEHE
jgi:hypothetical protein